MSSPRTALGLVVAAGLLVGGGVAAGALAATGALAASATPTPTPSVAAPGGPGQDGHGPGTGHRRGMGPGMGGFGLGAAGRMLHGEVVVAKDGGGTETLLVQHGTVTAKTSDSVTVRSSDGFTLTWKVGSDSRVLPGRPGSGAVTGLAAVDKDSDVMVVGPKTSGDPAARFLAVRPARMPDGAGAGKGWGNGWGHGPGDRRGPGAPASPAPSATTSPAALQG